MVNWCCRYYNYQETGFYYLQTRYYDPAICRFINADGQLNDGILGYNLFAYCENNPIMSIDPIGNCPQWVKSVVKYIAKNVVKPVVKTVQKALSKLNLTYSRGYNISGSPGLLNFNAQIGVSADTKGNIAIQATGGYGVTTGSPSGSITGYTSMTNAKDISALEGLYFQLGGTIAVPILEIPFAFGGDMMILPN